MQIYVNDQIVETKLEKEKNLGEVYEAVSNWVESSGKYLVSCRLDGQEVNKESLYDISIDDNTRLDFFVGEEYDMLQASLQELDNYVDKVGNTLFGRDSLTEREATDLSEGMTWISSVMQSTQSLLKLNFESIKPMGRGKSVREIVDYLKENHTHLETPDSIGGFLEHLRDFKLFLMDLITRTQILELSEKELKALIREFFLSMNELKTDFRKVNEMYQSGKDQSALDILTDSISKLNAILACLISLKNKPEQKELEEIQENGKSLGEATQSLKSILEKIAQAYEESDIIYAGDLIEYELPEVLDELVPFLRKISEQGA
jgi:hypothetical protein